MSWKELWDKASCWYAEHEDVINNVVLGVAIGASAQLLCDVSSLYKLQKKGFLSVRVGNGVGKTAADTRRVVDVMNSAVITDSYINKSGKVQYALADLGKFGEDILKQAREAGIPGVDPENMIQYVLTGFGKK